jgi:SAM-dependent methyltransferase
MSETAKAKGRRLEEGFFKYCIGNGIDIGCGYDPLFKRIDKYDTIYGNGDATLMSDVDDGYYDFVYSSHCLEHLCDPILALKNWFRILKNGGYLLLYVPHRDLYEKRKLLPSKWNGDHKFYILPEENDPPHTWGLAYLLNATRIDHKILQLKVCDFGAKDTGEDKHSEGEYSIEAVIKKHE